MKECDRIGVLDWYKTSLTPKIYMVLFNILYTTLCTWKPHIHM